MHTTLRSECPSRKSPRAADPNKITHSRFVAPNSFSLFTNSASFVSVDNISHPFLSPSPTSFRKPRRLRCCRRQIHQIRRRHLLLLRPSLRFPNHFPRLFQSRLRTSLGETKASRFHPIRLRLDQRDCL